MLVYIVKLSNIVTGTRIEGYDFKAKIFLNKNSALNFAKEYIKKYILEEFCNYCKEIEECECKEINDLPYDYYLPDDQYPNWCKYGICIYQENLCDEIEIKFVG